MASSFGEPVDVGGGDEAILNDKDAERSKTSGVVREGDLIYGEKMKTVAMVVSCKN